MMLLITKFSNFNPHFYSSIKRVLRTWIERYFDEDFYDPPHFPLLHRLIHLAEEVFDQDTDDVTCDFIEYVRSKLKSAEVKNLQESAIESKTCDLE